MARHSLHQIPWDYAEKLSILLKFGKNLLKVVQ